MGDPEEIRIVLIGKTGSGKSATGNSILGEKFFPSKASASSLTKNCSHKHVIRFNKKILVVDTPGIFDTAESTENIQKEISKCIALTSPGPHAFILVLSVGRHTDEGHKSALHFVNHFGEEIFKYFIVLFTGKDDLEVDDITLQQHMETFPSNLKAFVQNCGERVVAFNNRLHGSSTSQQVEELLSIILKNVKNNGGKWYTNDMFEEAERLNKEKEAETLKKANEEREKEMLAIEKKVAEKYKAEVESQIKDIENMNQRLIFVQAELASKKEIAEKDANKMKELQENKEREEKRLEELIKEQERERKRMERETNDKFHEIEKNLRDIIRKEIENERGLFGWIGDKIDGAVSYANPYNWFKKK